MIFNWNVLSRLNHDHKETIKMVIVRACVYYISGVEMIHWHNISYLNFKTIVKRCQSESIKICLT